MDGGAASQAKCDCVAQLAQKRRNLSITVALSGYNVGWVVDRVTQPIHELPQNARLVAITFNVAVDSSEHPAFSGFLDNAVGRRLEAADR